MKSTLPAQHLWRQYLLFVFTVTFLLTMFRAGFALWQFPRLEDTDAFVALFVQGLRFDLALIGIISLIPIVVGSVLSMFDVTRPLARFLIGFFLIVGLLLILLLEMITPWFVHTYALRPDVTILQNFASSQDAMLGTVLNVLKEQTIPVVFAVVLSVLILIAFWMRMEIPRFLRYRLSVTGALLTALLGGLLCGFAIWSTPDFRKVPLGPGDALISADATVNDLAMNSMYKTLYSIALPYFNQ